MNKILLAFAAAAALASTASAQSETLALQARGFEAAGAAMTDGFFLRDSFGGVPECAIIDAPAFRAWTLSEARERLAPCFDAVAQRYQSRVAVTIGFVADAQGGPAKAGLLLETGLVPGGMADRALSMSISRRGGRLMGQPVRVLTRGEMALAPVSAAQASLQRCVTDDVVRPIRDAQDFLSIYGRCLTGDAALGIAALKSAGGLAVAVTAQSPSAAALNGYVTANAGTGPVRVLVFVDGNR